MYSAGDDKNIYVWDLASGKLVETLIGHENAIVSLDFAGGDLLSASLDFSVMDWDLEDLYDRVEMKQAMSHFHLKATKFEFYYADDGKKKKKKPNKKAAAGKKK